MRRKNFKLIDEIVAVWNLSYVNKQKKEVRFIEYAKYKVFYNEGADSYIFTSSGFRPTLHYLNDELEMVISTLNNKIIAEGGEDIGFTNSILDYYAMKNTFILGNKTILNDDSDDEFQYNEAIYGVVQFKLEMSKDVLKEAFYSDDPYLKKILQAFKMQEFMSKDADIYNEEGNILTTSDGYYIATTHEIFNNFQKGLGDDPDNKKID